MALTQVTLSGTFKNPDGTACSGDVVFRLAAPILDGDGNVIVASSTERVTLSGTGTFSQVLYATEGTGLLPTGNAYVVEELITGADRRVYEIALPSTNLTPNLADFVPTTSRPTYELIGNGTPASTVVTETGFGQAAAVGAASAYARADHTHGTPTNPVTAHEAAADPHVQYRLEAANIPQAEVTNLVADLAAKVAASTLTANGNLLTRAGGVPAEVSRAALAADAAFTGTYAPKVSPTITPTDAAAIALTVQGTASQAGDLQRWQNSAAAAVARMDVAGRLGLGGAAPGGAVGGQQAVLSVDGYTGLGGFRINGADGTFPIYLDTAGTFRLGSASGDVVLAPGLVDAFRAIAAPADGNTGILVSRNVGGVVTMQTVSMGAADSGGAGFKVLRVPN